MTTLVTGGTGFVGSAVVRRLLEEGETVRVLTRPNADRRNLEGLAVEVVTGDLLDRASLCAALSGCQALFHIAADYRLWVPNPGTLYRTNVEATRTLMQAAGVTCHEIDDVDDLDLVRNGIERAFADRKSAGFLFPFRFWE